MMDYPRRSLTAWGIIGKLFNKLKTPFQQKGLAVDLFDK